MADLLPNPDGTHTYQTPKVADPLELKMPDTISNPVITQSSPTQQLGTLALSGSSIKPASFNPNGAATTQEGIAGQLASKGKSDAMKAVATRIAAKPVDFNPNGAATTDEGIAGQMLSKPKSDAMREAAKAFNEKQKNPSGNTFSGDMDFWNSMFPGVDQKAVQGQYFNPDGSIKIPEFAKNAYLEKLAPLIQEKIASSDDLMRAYQTQGINDLTRVWKDSWKGLMETASSMGLSQDGLGLMMMTQGRADLVDKLSTYSLNMAIQKGELDKNTVSWAMDLIKYGAEDATLKGTYYGIQMQGIKDMLAMSKSAYEFAKNYGLDAQRVNILQNQIDSEAGLGTFKAVLDGAAAGLIPPEAFDSIMEAAGKGDWTGVFKSIGQYADQLPQGTYTTSEDMVATKKLYDEGSILYNVVPYTDEKGNMSWDVNPILQTVVMADGTKMTGIATSKDNGQLNALSASATQQKKKIVSTRNADGTITYSIGTDSFDPETEDMVLDEAGGVTYQPVEGGTPPAPATTQVSIGGVTKQVDVVATPAKTGQPSWSVLRDPTTGQIYYRENYTTGTGKTDAIRTYDEVIAALKANPSWQTPEQTTFLNNLFKLGGEEPQGGLGMYVSTGNKSGTDSTIKIPTPGIFETNRATAPIMPEGSAVVSAQGDRANGYGTYSFGSDISYQTIGAANVFLGPKATYSPNEGTNVNNKKAWSSYDYYPVYQDGNLAGYLMATKSGPRLAMNTDFNTAWNMGGAV